MQSLRSGVEISSSGSDTEMLRYGAEILSPGGDHESCRRDLEFWEVLN